MFGQALWPSKPHTLSPGSSQPRRNAVLNDASLKISNGHENVELKLARWVHAAGVNALAWANQCNAMTGQLANNLCQVRQTAPEPVQLETHNHIQLAPSHVGHHLV